MTWHRIPAQWATALLAALGMPACLGHGGDASERRSSVASDGAQTRQPPPRTAWQRFEEALAWPIAGGRGWQSLGHGSLRATLQVRVSPEFLGEYMNLQPSTRAPDGTVVLARLGGAANQGSYLMVKSGGAWSFAVLDESGRAKPTPDSCASCHRQGRADSLFGPPLPASGTGGSSNDD